MAQKQRGGWYPNKAEGGRSMRWWGPNLWTDGEEPGQASTPTSQTPSSSGNLLSQYQAKLDPINQRSQGLLQDYSALSAQLPTFQQKLLDSIKQAGQYPSHAAMREEYAKNPDLTPMAVESLVSRRGQSTRGSIQDVMNRATSGLQSEIEGRRGAYEQAQGQRSNLLEDYQLQYQSEQDALDRVRQTEQDKFAREKSLRTGSSKATLSASQISDLRYDLADDVREDKQNNVGREQSIRENRVLYPELSDEEFDQLYEALWPKTEAAEESKPLFDLPGFIQNLLSPRNQPNIESGGQPTGDKFRIRA